MILAGWDWLWVTLLAAGFWSSAFVPTWMHGRAKAADAYADGWSDRETAQLGAHARQPGGTALELPAGREWAEITADWMAPEARAELAAWVQEMTLRAA